MSSNTSLGFYKLDNSIELPKFGTAGSACFDLAYQPRDINEITIYLPTNKKITRTVNNKDRSIGISPSERAMIPTSLILDIPEGHSVRIHPRSGLSLTKGVSIINCEGVIDSDFVDELFILVVNNSSTRVVLVPGDRIAQAELVESVKYTTTDISEKPTQKTDRKGGYGSTGTNSSSNNAPKLNQTEEQNKTIKEDKKSQ